MTNLNNQPNTNVSILSNFRRFFLTGLLVTAPIIITIYVTWLVITFIDVKVANLLPEYLDFRKALPFQIPGLGLLIVIFVITLIGAITPGLIGRNLLKLVVMIFLLPLTLLQLYLKDPNNLSNQNSLNLLFVELLSFLEVEVNC